MSTCQNGNPSLIARRAGPRGKRGRCHAPNAERCHAYPTKFRQRGWPKSLLSVDLLVGRRKGLQEGRGGWDQFMEIPYSGKVFGSAQQEDQHRDCGGNILIDRQCLCSHPEKFYPRVPEVPLDSKDAALAIMVMPWTCHTSSQRGETPRTPEPLPTRENLPVIDGQGGRRALPGTREGKFDYR
jgi:hypothetical protein